jgi:hypothetical protein
VSASIGVATAAAGAVGTAAAAATGTPAAAAAAAAMLAMRLLLLVGACAGAGAAVAATAAVGVAGAALAPFLGAAVSNVIAQCCSFKQCDVSIMSYKMHIVSVSMLQYSNTAVLNFSAHTLHTALSLLTHFDSMHTHYALLLMHLST